MARTETLLRVFVSSPNDVKEEVSTLGEIIRELNTTNFRSRGMRLEMVTWQTDVVPGISSDAQAVINEQIGDDYDIFMGILRGRFGTPTRRAGSGTEEEFERAYARYRSDPNSIRVMIYFNRGPISPDDIDIEQFKAVQSFRAQLGHEKGVLYWDFNSREEFEYFVRIHLSRQVQEWGRTWGCTSSTSLSGDVEPRSPHAANEPIETGALELIESTVEEMTIAIDSVKRVGQIFKDVAVRAEERTISLRRLGDMGSAVPQGEKKRLIKLHSGGLRTVCEELEWRD